jgi:PAS domain S-box-containing protein
VDLDFRITFFNSAAEKITGFDRDSALGRRCDTVMQSNICHNGCVLRKAIESQTPVQNAPVYIRRADDQVIPIHVQTNFLEDSQGNLFGGVETFWDLSEVTRLRKALSRRRSLDDIVSKNEKMQQIFSVLPRIAASHSTVLIVGDSGTGKELIARAIHAHSRHRRGPFVAVNCGGMPETLCESELFGYCAGAFTDAKKDKPGRFAIAQNGTIFLDEIGDIPMAIQTRLLRVLQDKSYEPLGATGPQPTNARVIAATNRNIDALVEKGIFREDLFFRLNVIRLRLPPLCERKEDIPLLVYHFINHFNVLENQQIAGVTREAMAALMLYDWPGNVRELENAMEHAMVLCAENMIGLEHLPDHLTQPLQHRQARDLSGLTLREAEKRIVEQALQRNQWRKMATARELGIDKNTLRRKILRLEIQPPVAGSRSDR